MCGVDCPEHQNICVHPSDKAGKTSLICRTKRTRVKEGEQFNPSTPCNRPIPTIVGSHASITLSVLQKYFFERLGGWWRVGREESGVILGWNAREEKCGHVALTPCVASLLDMMHSRNNIKDIQFTPHLSLPIVRPSILSILSPSLSLSHTHALSLLQACQLPSVP